MTLERELPKYVKLVKRNLDQEETCGKTRNGGAHL